MVLTRLATLVVWGAAALAPQTPPAPKPATVRIPATAPAQTAPQTDAERVAKLRELVEASEKALDAEDEEGAFDHADEAEVLVADWDEALLQRPDVQILLERLKGVQNQVPQGGAPAAQGTRQVQEPQAGLKEAGQVTILQGSELSSEQAKVQAADQGATYDFPIDLNDKVLTWVRLFTTERRGYMERTLARGAAYFPMIRQVFAEEGVPQDLAYLGVVESGYINRAKSYARAVGMWQFMPSTGRLFGLKINRWVDERRDPVKATHAAARYLKRLYDLSGDWYLALVGYNAGPLTTQKAQVNLGTSNFWDMYRSPYLRNQTKNYVPEMCAAVLIGRNQESYGFQASPDAPFVYETVQVRSATSLRVVARNAGASEAAIKELNPQLLRGTTPPGPYEVRVPVGKGLETQRRLGGLPASQREDLGSYRIRKGDTLAKVAKRFNVEPDELLQANRISKSGFRAGRRIVIPPPAAAGEPAPREGEEKPPVNRTPLDAIPSIPGGLAQAQTPPALAPADISYRARPGDTLARIARAQGVSFSELVRLNPEAVKHLGVGDVVTLPGKEGASAAAPGAPGSPVLRPRIYTVQRGETLAAIADRFGVTIPELKRWNRLRSAQVRAGQRLWLAQH
ncbi:MAG TPA: LysM peptidoglycan-binding domain-containing protein [Holophagaceae bacterium]|jgi:membrane-bound lytic murein transglycosylase D|nr:LysM peptidoglycan-binding domain-containing protein [Holophagaceae bacterium]